MTRGSTPVTPTQNGSDPAGVRSHPGSVRRDGDRRRDPARLPLQGASILSGDRTSWDFGARHPLPARALGYARRSDDPGSIARGDRRSFRPGPASLRADGTTSQGQSTMPRLLALLRSMGIAISKRQLVRLLNENHQGLIAAKRRMFCARGWQHRPGSAQDDTGARHAGKNGFCTQIGNEWSAGSARGRRKAG